MNANPAGFGTTDGYIPLSATTGVVRYPPTTAQIGGSLPHAPVQPPDTRHVNEIVRLNVGGTHYETLYDTLANGTSRFFEHMFRIDQRTGRVILFKQHIIEDGEGRIFINRDGKLFSYILQFFRDGKRTILPDSLDILRRLIREAEYFAIDRYRAMLVDRVSELERVRDMGTERFDSLQSAVQQISQQLYMTNFKK